MAEDPVPETWEGERADRWVSRWPRLDAQLGPVTERLSAAADAQPGERVLDIGCGTGPTTRLLAEQVGVGGSVVGLDVAAAMLDVARAQPVPDGAAAIDWVEADAMTWSGHGAPFDLVYSRFGSMFFTDPDAAFANLRSLVAPTGRLCMATWQPRDRSPLFELTLTVIESRCAEWGIDPEIPGPAVGAFALHEPAVRELLDRTGWRDVRAESLRLSFPVDGGAKPEDAAAGSLSIGAARTAMEGLTDDQRADIASSLTSVYEDHVSDDGFVRLDGGVVITTARP